MSQPESIFQSALPNWVDSTLFKGMLRGIERESLRMQSNGFLSQKDHPQALGSALTHPHITTDYSEALMEFITPPQDTIPQALNYLKDIHAVAHRHLEDGEKLWPLSMPCMLDDDEESIRLAEYGTSNVGRFKTLYRKGLGVRYGRRMQTISGVHYNVSFPDQLFEELQKHEWDPELKALNLQDYRSHRYFGLIRNFIRLTPLVMYLIGASPAVCRCFMTGREHHLLPLVKGTLHLPYATALRMGNFGYQNSAQKELGIHYNNLPDYLVGLQQAVNTP
ncbi:MAG: glutamate--cysteine ligase, partial [Acinetobacter sp.]|nr:glutamate--cysteine ligase [Acinetobacter sp.]